MMTGLCGLFHAMVIDPARQTAASCARAVGTRRRVRRREASTAAVGARGLVHSSLQMKSIQLDECGWRCVTTIRRSVSTARIATG